MIKSFIIKEDNFFDFHISSISNIDLQIIESYVTTYTKSGSKVKERTTNTFRDKYGFDIINIVAYGDTNKVNHHILGKFIDSIKVTYNWGNKDKKTLNAYKCFDNDDFHNEKTRIIYHEDKQSSWNCLLNRINNPKYVIIYKIRNDG